MSKGNLFKTLNTFSFMPLPLPWFDNQIDPLLPTDIKPLLYLYDQYQTYDLVEWSQLTTNWGNNLFPFDFLNYSPNEYVYTILVERFTPWNYEWAEHYSTKIFNFIYDYTGTDYDTASSWIQPIPGGINSVFSGNYITGKFYDSTSGYQWQGDSFYSRREDYISNEQVILNIPATQQEQVIIITWLEYDYLDMASNEVNSSLRAILVKRYKKIFSSTQSPFNVSLSFTSIALCSTVVSSSDNNIASNIKQQLSSQRGILYENIDDILSELRTRLAATFPRLFKVIDTVKYSYSFEVRCEGGAQGASYENLIGGNYYENYFMPSIYRQASFTYRERPTYYRSACLLYANNNYWQNGVIYNDLGKNPNFYINPLLSQEYQPLYPHHDLIYIENVNFPEEMSTQVWCPAKIPGYISFGGHQQPDQDVGFLFVGQPFAFTYGSLLKTTSGEKHLVYQIESSWNSSNNVDPLSGAYSFYDVYKYYVVLTHHGDGAISSQGGSVEKIGTNSHPSNGEIFTYFDSQHIDVTINYHYFDNDSNSGNSTTSYRIALSDEEAIRLIDEYLYESSVIGEFDHA